MILKIFLSLLASFSYSLGFPPRFFLGTIISLILYFFCLNGKLKSDLGITFIYVFGMFLFGYYWIPQTISEFGEMPLVAAQILSVFFPFVLMPHFFCFIIFSFLFRKKLEKFPLPLKNCILAFFFTLLEYFIPQQFPANIGHPFLQIAPFLGLARIFGVPIYSFFSVWISFSIVSLLKKEGKDYFGIAFFILFMMTNLVLPVKYDGLNPISTRIRMVQANIGNFLKVDSEKGGVTSREEVDFRFRKYSTLPTDKKIDLIIWPETAYPEILHSKNMKVSAEYTPLIIREILKETNSMLFFGGYDQNGNLSQDSAESNYNSGFLINQKGLLEGVFHKQILLPFGEGLPFGHFNKYMIPYLENHMSFFARGDQFTLFKIGNSASFISAICYEILFPQYIREYLNSSKEQPQFIINLTNDSWYGRSSEPYQHLFLSHWRAIEFNLPVVRMTNTGFTSVLYPDGSESKRTKLFSQEIVDLDLKTFERIPTIYQRWGIIPLCGLFIIIYFGVLVFLDRKIFRFSFKRNTLS